MTATPDAFIDWYRKLWSTRRGDREETLASVEQQLGIRLPGLLRAVYRHTSLRRSQLLHLVDVEDLVIEDDVLVFARDQQATWGWGIPLNRLQDGDPELVANPLGSWQDDGCTLEGFLRFFALANRPYESPCVSQTDFDPARLTAPWVCHAVAWHSLQHELWTNGEAVLEEVSGNLGARDSAALHRAAESLGIDEEEVSQALEDW